MNRNKQERIARIQKFRAQERMKKALTPWIVDISRTYNIGNTAVTDESILLLQTILRQFYINTSRLVLGFDYRTYKQNEEEIEKVIRRSISEKISLFFSRGARAMAGKISETASKFVQRVTLLATENKWTPTEAMAALRNYLSNHTITIAVTEAQTVVETTRATAVLSVTDPLKDSMQRMVALIRAGDFNGANRLSREIMKLAKLPTSVSQGELIQFITDNRDRLVTPRFQAQSVARILREAEKLDKNLKKWQAIGDSKTRETHLIADRAEPIPVDEPFILPGGALQWPGDATLGAALREIIGCRCTAIYL